MLTILFGLINIYINVYIFAIIGDYMNNTKMFYKYLWKNSRFNYKFGIPCITWETIKLIIWCVINIEKSIRE